MAGQNTGNMAGNTGPEPETAGNDRAATRGSKGQGTPDPLAVSSFTADFVPDLAPGLAAPVRAGDLAIVVGAGASGEAAARLLHSLGARVRLLDRSSANVSEDFRREAAKAGLEVLCGPHTPEQFLGASCVVASPGVPFSTLLPLTARAGNPPVMAEMELALRYVVEPILAVTGTSGKTTTVSLAAAMLEKAGKKVFLGGNIGTPLSSHVLQREKADVLVLELSSFQLQGCWSMHPKAAVLLNLTENHLDHHKDMAEYTDAKFSLFALQTAGDAAILPQSLLEEYVRRGFSGRVEILESAEAFADTLLAGGHNAANAGAAYLACREFGVTRAVAAEVVASFAPLRHRLELAGTVNGALYVNDSKCTTVAALRAALTSFDAPLVLLAGGKFKGGDLPSLRPLLQEKVKAVVLFGASREIFEQAWLGASPLSWDPDLGQALVRAEHLALPGDVVLLSPATASYDLYTNYQERGDHFCRLVKEKVEIDNPGATAKTVADIAAKAACGPVAGNFAGVSGNKASGAGAES